MHLFLKVWIIQCIMYNIKTTCLVVVENLDDFKEFFIYFNYSKNQVSVFISDNRFSVCLWMSINNQFKIQTQNTPQHSSRLGNMRQNALIKL